jgi:hypothetical protein
MMMKSLPNRGVVSGNASFAKYVALRFIAAGFSDGALFVKGQKEHIPIYYHNNLPSGGGDFKLLTLLIILGDCFWVEM